MTIEEEQPIKTEVTHLEVREELAMQNQRVEELLEASDSAEQPLKNRQAQPKARENLSPVAQLFTGSSVFVTGASGFIGRVLLEKLLRSYEGIERIYILLRPKKNLQPYERLHKHLLRAPIFDQIRAQKNGQELLEKIVVLSGDIGEDKLGMSDEDTQRLLQDPTLSIVFHSAASVKFDEPLKASIKFNLQATKLIIELCKRMKSLKCLCHVSTAYANSDQRDGQTIEETLYPMHESPNQVLQLAELMDDSLMQKLKVDFVGQRPNTYTYTKALAEHLIALEASDLPVVIVRPSIVVAAWKEPLPGWIDNLNGPTGIVLAIGKGVLRTMRASHPCKADLIPVDIVVNTMIAAAHYAAVQHQNSGQPISSTKCVLSNNGQCLKDGRQLEAAKLSDEQQQQQQQLVKGVDCNKVTTQVPPIFHCASGDTNPITWGQMEAHFWPIILKYPSEQVLRYPGGSFKANKFHDLITRFIVHYLPALFIDLLCLILGKKRQLLSLYNKLHRAIAALDNFSTTDYNFRTNNFKILQASLTHPLDRNQLYMDISKLNWTNYWDDYILGARRYVLREEDKTLSVARKSFRRARYVEYGIRAFLMLMAVACLYPLFGPFVRQSSAFTYEQLVTT